MAELQEPLRGEDVGVRVGGGGVDADDVRGELVDPDGLLVQVTLQGAEGGAGAETAEPVGEPVVVGVRGQHGFAEEGGEGALVLRDPRLDMVEAVVSLGDEEEEPDGQDIARGERAFPVERGGKVAVQGGRQVQMLEGGPQDGEVGQGFHAQQARFGGAHSSSLPTSFIPENHLQHERTVRSSVSQPGTIATRSPRTGWRRSRSGSSSRAASWPSRQGDTQQPAPAPSNGS